MPPIVALVLTTGFVAWLFFRDESRRDGTSWALWLPLAWLFITGTRFVSQWIALGQWSGSATSEDGSPLDAIVFGMLTLVGCLVLVQRRVSIGSFVRRNPWIFLLLAYGLVSVVWSDLPFVSLKRWVKSLGNLVMALIIVTEENPRAAFLTVVRGLGYLVVPYSVMLVKYFPEYGRGFDGWTGVAYNQGVSLSKNGLGQLCVVIGIALVWKMQILRRARERASEWLVPLGMLVLLAWLILIADSKTSQVALLTAVGTMVLIHRVPALRARFLLWSVLGASTLLLADWAFDIRENIIVALGRDPTLTDRTEIWADVIALQPNVLLGAGYEAFWLGERLQTLWSVWLWQPNQAHSSYVEMYANGGLIGLGLLLCMMISAFRSAARDLRSESQAEADWARFRMAMLLAIAFCGYAEALFKGVNLMWTVFYVIAWTAGPPLPARRLKRNQQVSPSTQQPRAFAATRGAGRARLHSPGRITE